jgi:transcriptional regulator GlxA family with amidase domain
MQNVGVLVFGGVEELDFAGPLEMLSMWGKYVGGPPNTLIVAQTREPVVGAHGLSINPHTSFEQCPALDLLLVPGGPGTRSEVNNPALVDFVRRQGQGAQALLSVCTGAFVLHAAGLLAGKRATTHWQSLQRLRDLGDVTVLEQRWVRDGKVWSSAGVSAGMDLTLAFIAATAGDDAAGRVQLATEYYPDGARYGAYDNHPQAPAYLKR